VSELFSKPIQQTSPPIFGGPSGAEFRSAVMDPRGKSVTSEVNLAAGSRSAAPAWSRGVHPSNCDFFRGQDARHLDPTPIGDRSLVSHILRRPTSWTQWSSILTSCGRKLVPRWMEPTLAKFSLLEDDRELGPPEARSSTEILVRASLNPSFPLLTIPSGRPPTQRFRARRSTNPVYLRNGRSLVPYGNL
jgi:hypothetical protein